MVINGLKLRVGVWHWIPLLYLWVGKDPDIDWKPWLTTVDCVELCGLLIVVSEKTGQQNNKPTEIR